MEQKHQEMLKVRQVWTYDKGMQESKRRTRPHCLVENWKLSNKHIEKYALKNSGDRGRKKDSRRRRVRKRRRLPVKDGLRSRPERKPIIVRNVYTALNYTKLWENDKDDIIIKSTCTGKQRSEYKRNDRFRGD